MTAHLLLTVRLHDARFHGVHEWPPSPARVFQALVAGCARGATLPDGALRALEHLELLEPPLIAAPRFTLGQEYGVFVPNNDADALSGDLSKLPDIRTRKAVRPRLLHSDTSFLYAWALPDPKRAPLDELVQVSHELYQLGRGVDLAWADAEVLSSAELATRMEAGSLELYRPSGGQSSTALACPTRGTLQSLIARFQASLSRLSPSGTGTTWFAQPPKPLLLQVGYGAGPARLLYELRSLDGDDLQVWPLWRATALVERLRDGAVAKLRNALPDMVEVLERSLVGRTIEGVTPAQSERVRLWPLASIGHSHADQGIRRVAVTVPRGVGVSVADVHWAFSGLMPCDPESGEVDPIVLTPTVDLGMLDHFVVASRCWRSVTPLALPEAAKRRRIDPTRRAEESKGGMERAEEESRARLAVLDALRHAGVAERPTRIEVQREPFDRKGTRAERFAVVPRFPKERLWHVRLRFGCPVEGPLALGDGRFLGLGVMAPVREPRGAYSLWIDSGLSSSVDPVGVARALRRAVMSRVQSALGRQSLPLFFSGHHQDGTVARFPEQPHIAFQSDLPNRLLVITPEHFKSTNGSTPKRLHELLDAAVTQVRELRAGGAGLLQLTVRPIDPEDEPLFSYAQHWESVTPYTVNRHRKVSSPAEALSLDVVAECVGLGLPEPRVSVASLSARSGSGLMGTITLEFPRPVRGPILIGRTRHLGGGLFRPVEGYASPSKGNRSL